MEKQLIDPATIPGRRAWCRRVAELAEQELRAMGRAGEPAESLLGRARDLMAASDAVKDDPKRIDQAHLEFLDAVLAWRLYRARLAALAASRWLGQGGRGSRRSKGVKAGARKAREAKYWIDQATRAAGLQSRIAEHVAARNRTADPHKND